MLILQLNVNIDAYIKYSSERERSPRSMHRASTKHILLMANFICITTLGGGEAQSKNYLRKNVLGEQDNSNCNDIEREKISWKKGDLFCSNPNCLDFV